MWVPLRACFYCVFPKLRGWVLHHFNMHIYNCTVSTVSALDLWAFYTRQSCHQGPTVFLWLSRKEDSMTNKRTWHISALNPTFNVRAQWHIRAKTQRLTSPTEVARRETIFSCGTATTLWLLISMMRWPTRTPPRSAIPPRSKLQIWKANHRNFVTNRTHCKLQTASTFFSRSDCFITANHRNFVTNRTHCKLQSASTLF